MTFQNLNKVSLTCVFFILAFSFLNKVQAHPIDVKIEAPEMLRLHHSGHISLGIKYSDDTISSWNLFTREEFRNNLTSKKIELSDNLEVAECKFHWSIMQNPPQPLTQETITLLHDSSFDGIYMGDCVIDQESQQITLHTHFKFEEMEITIHRGALENHKASYLIGSLKVPHIDRSFNFDHMDKSTGTSYKIRVLHSLEKFDPSVNLTWYTDNGGVVTENIKVLPPKIEIK